WRSLSPSHFRRLHAPIYGGWKYCGLCRGARTAINRSCPSPRAKNHVIDGRADADNRAQRVPGTGQADSGFHARRRMESIADRGITGNILRTHPIPFGEQAMKILLGADRATKKPIYLPTEALPRHVHMVGYSGSGKTT